MEDPQKIALREMTSASKSTAISRQVEGKEWDKAVVRRMYVKAVEHLPCTESIMKQAIQKVWAKIQSPPKVPHWVNVCAWKRKYLANSKDAFALAEQHQRKGNRISRYPLEVIEIAEDCIDRLYMRRERSTVQETLEEAVVMITRENNQRPSSQQLPRPTRRLIERLINTCLLYTSIFLICGFDSLKRFSATISPFREPSMLASIAKRRYAAIRSRFCKSLAKYVWLGLPKYRSSYAVSKSIGLATLTIFSELLCALLNKTYLGSGSLISKLSTSTNVRIEVGLFKISQIG